MTFIGTTLNEWTVPSFFFAAKRSHLDEADAGTGNARGGDDRNGEVGHRHFGDY
jgi:hypothetical protein